MRRMDGQAMGRVDKRVIALYRIRRMGHERTVAEEVYETEIWPLSNEIHGLKLNQPSLRHPRRVRDEGPANSKVKTQRVSS